MNVFFRIIQDLRNIIDERNPVAFVGFLPLPGGDELEDLERALADEEGWDDDRVSFTVRTLRELEPLILHQRWEDAMDKFHELVDGLDLVDGPELGHAVDDNDHVM